MTAEERRLQESQARTAHWKRWGPYLSERAWGTVREDYSSDGNAWEYFPHDHARSRAYRWGEDGLGGICDRHQYICFALALWNGRDPILKERLFGLSGLEGNHGEDVKEYYFYLDSTPTHSYMKYLYKYPQVAFPYDALVEENRRRDRYVPEWELLDSGVFDENRYFDVFIEYAKATPEDILICLSIVNRSPETASLNVLPTLWFRNTWAWGLEGPRPLLRQAAAPSGVSIVAGDHPYYGHRWLVSQGDAELLFTDNETNKERLWNGENNSRYVKDGINDYIVRGVQTAVNPDRTGTKAAVRYFVSLGPGETTIIRLRLTDTLFTSATEAFGTAFDSLVKQRQREADEFYLTVIPQTHSSDARGVMRQAFAGLLWGKQFYHYDVGRWHGGDSTEPLPAIERQRVRNHEWRHLYNADVISMPDKWEYPWYAAWDLAFHCLPLALLDIDFAKEQLILFLREWYMHPNGQLPAYEWNFSDVNPPVHAWAAWRVYKIEQKRQGTGDRAFLERIFHKLLLNFTWWVNRKDTQGRNIFQGGFLGLDNIGLFDRSAPLSIGGHLEQADATSWMGMYCLNMLAIALELAHENPVYQDTASKFFEHFVYICRAMHNIDGDRIGLWDEQDGFYYDVIHAPGHSPLPLKVRSMVGLIPLFAVEILSSEQIDALPGFKRRLQWFVDNRPELAEHIETTTTADGQVRLLLSLVNRARLRQLLRYLLDEDEFFSPYGIRSLSRFHQTSPYCLTINETSYRIEYEAAESTTALFGGNSNWRGPVWFPVNFLLIESLQRFHHYLGDDYTVECPAGSGQRLTLWEVATELSRRLILIFLRDATGHRPVYGGINKLQSDPYWRDLILFYEYFHGDTGAGLGAGHQTGWTALIAKLLQQSGG